MYFTKKIAKLDNNGHLDKQEGRNFSIQEK